MITTSTSARTSGITKARTGWAVVRVSLLAGAAALAVVEAYGAVVFARWAARPARAFLATTLALLALSLVGPLTAQGTTATRLTLAGGHLIAAAVIIPAVTRRLAAR
jgi:hypothetical protein